MRPADSVAIVSGGLDSTTLVYHMLKRGMTPRMLSFNYGQRHKKELQFAENTARTLHLQWDVVDLTGITHLISNSALTSTSGIQFDEVGKEVEARDIEVPDGHYAEETMKATVVPNRNMIMLAIATGVAVNDGLQSVGMGVHAGDHFIYPDCRQPFFMALEGAILLGNQGFGPFWDYKPTDARLRSFLYTPFISRSKSDIAYRALELGVPLHMTWSCYKGGEKHCGKCGTCVERLESIDEALTAWNSQPSHVGVVQQRVDYTEYEDTEYWRTQVKRGPQSADLHTA